nr:hypothetical protein [Anaerolineae bacterium]
MSDLLEKYRTNLMTAEQKAQDDYDKNLIALSGGALGITFAFIKDIIGSNSVVNPNYILVAWILWAISISIVLLSFYSSNWALRKAIKQVDIEKIYDNHPGGWQDILTGILNALGGILFVVGVIFAAIFTHSNL